MAAVREMVYYTTFSFNKKGRFLRQFYTFLESLNFEYTLKYCIDEKPGAPCFKHGDQCNFLKCTQSSRTPKMYKTQEDFKLSLID